MDISTRKKEIVSDFSLIYETNLNIYVKIYLKNISEFKSIISGMNKKGVVYIYCIHTHTHNAI